MIVCSETSLYGCDVEVKGKGSFLEGLKVSRSREESDVAKRLDSEKLRPG